MPTLPILKAERRKFYNAIGVIQCPIIGADVWFTAQGFDHLINESNSTYYKTKPRLAGEQYLKLKCLEYAPEVIAKCIKVTKKRNIQKMVKGVLKDALQYELVHEVAPGKKIRVIVEKVGNGKHKFVSIMWHDKKSKPKKRPNGRS